MLHSRIHPLKFIAKPHSKVYIKREDELGFGISGTKLRKYESLMAHIKELTIQHAVLIGGAYSNNIVGLTQLLIERGITPHLLLRGDHPPLYQGNFLLTSLLVPASQIAWVPRADWDQVTRRAQALVESFPAGSALLIPEGACMVEALAGSLSLAEDIVRNEQEHQLEFGHIFLEAGTGLAAIGLIIGLAIQARNPSIHIVLLALTQQEFLNRLQEFYQQLLPTMKESITWERLVEKLHFYTPTSASSFGSTNHQIFETIIQVARQDGILIDPVYTAKLLRMSKQIILDTPHIIGNILVIHCGGGLGMMGFQAQLEKQLRKGDK
jgi:1-aminocyclopropane-1-carboxylate deaminase/D-cysteine desulfhydrase-like pyridoxal-dependent ACC family enzyme